MNKTKTVKVEQTHSIKQKAKASDSLDESVLNKYGSILNNFKASTEDPIAESLMNSQLIFKKQLASIRSRLGIANSYYQSAIKSSSELLKENTV